MVIGKQVVARIVLAALVGTILPYAINIASFVGLRIYRTDVMPAFHAPGGLLTAAIALGFRTPRYRLSVDQPVIPPLTVAVLLIGFIVLYVSSNVTAAPGRENT